MKTLIAIFLAICLALPLAAQPGNGPPPPPQDAFGSPPPEGVMEEGEGLRRHELMLLHRLLRMPPEHLARLRETVARVEAMSEEERDALRARLDEMIRKEGGPPADMLRRFESLDPEDRAALRRHVLTLPPEERHAFFKELRRMDPDDRRATLDALRRKKGPAGEDAPAAGEDR